MTRFTRGEFQSMVDSYYGMVNKNEMTQREAFSLMAATLVRMTVYQTMLFKAQALFFTGASMIVNSLRGDDEEEDNEYMSGLDDASIGQQIGQGALGSALSLLVFRRMGNIGRTPLAMGIELMNAKYGEDVGIREGDYDFHSSIVYSPFVRTLNLSEKGYYNPGKEMILMAANSLGPYNKAAKNAFYLFDSAAKGGVKNPFSENNTYFIKPLNKTKKSRDSHQRKASIRLVETGLLSIGAPFPRDVRKLLIHEIYKDYKKKDKVILQNPE